VAISITQDVAASVLIPNADYTEVLVAAFSHFRPTFGTYHDPLLTHLSQFTICSQSFLDAVIGGSHVVT
jgi:hypothetical protein